MVCSLSRKNHAEMEKKMTTPTLPPPAMTSWKKIRSKSGGHLYHHIHELDCIQFIMGPATRVTMTGGNVAHSGPEFGDEDDMLFLNLEFGNNTYAIVEYGSAFTGLSIMS